MLSYLTFTALVVAVSAGPISLTERTTTTCKTQTQNANFDDLTGIPGTETNPIPMGYKGLYFQGFTFSSAANAGTGLQPGTLTHSPPNFATSTVITTTQQGSPEWTTNYQNSIVKSFTPKSFYYGCALNTATAAASLPQACNIAITGFKKGDVTAEAVQVAAQEFSYNPTTNIGLQQLALGTFSAAFADVQYVLLQYTLPGGSAALQPDVLFHFDDLVFTTCS